MSRSDLSGTSIMIEQADIEPFDRGTGVTTLPYVGKWNAEGNAVTTGMTIFSPGTPIQLHTHNVDESVLILAGEASAVIGDETSRRIVIVRENTEGLHLARESRVGNDTLLMTRAGVERVVRFAFELAGIRSGAQRTASAALLACAVRATSGPTTRTSRLSTAAPTTAGRGVANPTSQILSAAMLLDHLGHSDLARRINRAVMQSYADGAIRIDESGRVNSTQQEPPLQ
jgi:isocitrate/isopropylmalate dehydrogenase